MGKEKKTINTERSAGRAWEMRLAPADAACRILRGWDQVFVFDSSCVPSMGTKSMLSDMHAINDGGAWNLIISNFLIHFKIPKSHVKIDFLVAATKMPPSLVSFILLVPLNKYNISHLSLPMSTPPKKKWNKKKNKRCQSVDRKRKLWWEGRRVHPQEAALLGSLRVGAGGLNAGVPSSRERCFHSWTSLHLLHTVQSPFYALSKNAETKLNGAHEQIFHAVCEQNFSQINKILSSGEAALERHVRDELWAAAHPSVAMARGPHPCHSAEGQRCHCTSRQTDSLARRVRVLHAAGPLDAKDSRRWLFLEGGPFLSRVNTKVLFLFFL